MRLLLNSLLIIIFTKSIVSYFNLPSSFCKSRLITFLNSQVTRDVKDINRFSRLNPKSDKFSVRNFHHLEYYCGDATFSYKRFMLGLGMELSAKSDLSTGNTAHASYIIQSDDVKMLFTAPYMESELHDKRSFPFPHFNRQVANNFTNKHGLGVHAIAIEVDDVFASFHSLVNNGAHGVLEPITVVDQHGKGEADFAEISLYGDVVLRLLNKDRFNGNFLPNFSDVNCPLPALPWLSGAGENTRSYKITRFDHVVGNLHKLSPRVEQLKSITGFHEFAEFTTEDVGTVDSGLNSVVLANNNQLILLPLNEPTFGTKRKSQIQTYLEQNCGEGVQHIALYTPDIFHTLRCMRAASAWGGFDFMERPPVHYYRNLPHRLGDALTAEQYQQIEELGVLADKDPEGILLQIFTKPVGDRPTLFLEIIQRIGCLENGSQRPGCGGFGKGNFRDLFKSIEEYEKTLKI